MKTPKKIRRNDGWWLHTECFRPAAAHFEQNGVYTFLQQGSDEWVDFWKEEKRRCEEGYEVGGERITGHHYHYLNYVPIKRSIKGSKNNRKRIAFPLFYDFDYEFFWCLDIAQKGIGSKELKALKLRNPPLETDGGYHFIVNKARRRGYSYKVAAIISNIYNTQPNTLSLVGASMKSYLYPTGTMTMIRKVLDHLNTHTAFAKQRGVINKQDHYKASFIKVIDGKEVEAGYQSEIVAVTYNDNPDSARGKSAELVAFEEAGTFNNLELSYAATRPVVEDGDLTTGTIIVFGTSGEGSSAEYANFFYTPQAYKFLSFNNIWDEGAEDQVIGFFHPVWANMTPYIDEHGNSLVEKSIEAEQKSRKGLTPAALRARMMEYPFSPSEAFLSVSGNSFPVQELKSQLARVKSDKAFMNRGVHGYLSKDDGIVKFHPDTKGFLIPINSFDNPPVDKTGCVTIYEQPDKSPVKGQYIIGYDPIFQNNSTDLKPSLAAIYVMKTYAKFSYTAGTIVANYVGRPNQVDDAHRIAVLLSEYYNNAEIMHENMAKDCVNYFTNKKKLHLLASQPQNVISAAIKNSKTSRQWGVHMPTQLKDAGEKYVKAWLLEEVSVDETGNTVLRLETIYDQGLLEELIKYSPDPKKNFDRVIALFLLMFSIKEDEAKFRNETNESLKKNLESLGDYLRNKYKRNAPRQTSSFSVAERI